MTPPYNTRLGGLSLTAAITKKELTPELLAASAVEALQAGDKRMTVIVPRPWVDRPLKFPRGERLSEQDDKQTYSFEALKVIAWLSETGLVNVTAIFKPPNAVVLEVQGIGTRRAIPLWRTRSAS